MAKPDMGAPLVTLVGCGKMGSALLRGWIASGIEARFCVVEPAGLPDAFKDAPVTLCDTPPADSAVIILAVKPQVMDQVCAGIVPAPQTLILSIAAGKRIGVFESLFGATQPIIRAMPNTPAAIGRGITVAVPNPHVSPAHKTLADALLQAGGAVEWIDDEGLMDAVTALSGSGPAYLFHLIEAMTQGGIANGLPPALAGTLARATVIGAAQLAEADPESDAASLRRAVTSPGGTTEAALNVLMDEKDGLPPLMERAITAATKRSQAL